jgi:hypothetical protein
MADDPPYPPAEGPQMLAPSEGGPSGSRAANPEPELGGHSMPTVYAVIDSEPYA